MSLFFVDDISWRMGFKTEMQAENYHKGGAKSGPVVA
jgi:hypothetical protein